MSGDIKEHIGISGNENLDYISFSTDSNLRSIESK